MKGTAGKIISYIGYGLLVVFSYILFAYNRLTRFWNPFKQLPKYADWLSNTNIVFTTIEIGINSIIYLIIF